MTQDVEEILEQLREFATDEQKERVSERGVDEENVIGAPKGTMRDLAKSLGCDQKLADKLWKTEVHEARLLAVWIADPEKATVKSILKWAKDVQTWDLADQISRYLVPETTVFSDVIDQFVTSEEEYIKRIGFGSIACVAMHHPDQRFEILEAWLEKIVEGAEDEREHVQKGVLWALLEIGKIDEEWQDAAIVTACELQAEGPIATQLGHEAEETLSNLVSVSDRRRLISGNSKTAKNQNQGQGQGRGQGQGQSRGRNNNSGGSNRNNNNGRNNNNNNNNRRGRGGGQQNSQSAEGGSDGSKPARRNGRNKRRSRPSTPKPV